MTDTVWLDGQLVDADAASVSAMDHGVTVGDGVFETMRLYGGVPFARRRHLDRMERSAAGLGLALPDRSYLERAVEEVCAASGLDDGRVRLTVTTGVGPAGSSRGDGPCTVLAVACPRDPLPPTIDVHVVPWTRNENSPLAGIKSTSYGENVVALARAKANGAGEAIFANTKGELCEGTGTNVAVLFDGRLVTPPLSSGCLAGVTRELAIERCGLEELAVPVGALAAAGEACLLGTTREIHPIHAVDGVALPACPGPATAELAARFRALVESDLDP
jgi:branched-chain amino acid aminotransferase